MRNEVSSSAKYNLEIKLKRGEMTNINPEQ